MFSAIGRILKAAWKARKIGEAIKETEDVFRLVNELADKYADTDDDARRLKVEVKQAWEKWAQVF